jgi:hypothetical protein
MASLSPLTRFRLFAPLVDGDIAGIKKRERRVREITVYQCPDCFERYDWEEEAEECCGNEPEGEYHCPVCRQGNKDNHEAANCCLWKDLDPMARYRIAMAVDAGAEWQEAIVAVMGAV